MKKQTKTKNTLTRTEELLKAMAEARRLQPSSEEFSPDWREFWTPAKAEEQLKGFKFLGPGWYLTKDDTLLVLPSYDPEKCHFLIYNNRNPCEAFNQIANAPTKVDTRE